MQALQPRRWFSFGSTRGPIAVIRIAAIITMLALLAVAAIQSGPVEEAAQGAVTSSKTVDPLAADLARCRTVSAEQLASDDTCRRVWAENRRRFYTPAESEAR